MIPEPVRIAFIAGYVEALTANPDADPRDLSEIRKEAEEMADFYMRTRGSAARAVPRSREGVEMSETADCPRARLSMTPCVMRDGELAFSDYDSLRGDVVCVGCGWTKRRLRGPVYPEPTGPKPEPTHD